jgi:hypothetical protein
VTDGAKLCKYQKSKFQIANFKIAVGSWQSAVVSCQSAAAVLIRIFNHSIILPPKRDFGLRLNIPPDNPDSYRDRGSIIPPFHYSIVAPIAIGGRIIEFFQSSIRNHKSIKS